MDKQEQEQFNELVRIVAGYEGCGDCDDCDDCSFSCICGDREVAQKLCDEGWRKEKKDG